MDYEKLYEEALERARAGKPMAEVFPELKESEEERIREEIIRFLYAWRGDSKVDKWIAWLEKQKEQKKVDTQDLPHWKRMIGACGSGDDFVKPFLIRYGKGVYAQANCVGPNDVYIDLAELEKLPMPNDVIEDNLSITQKEQKPNIELIQKSWYMEGYHDGKYNNEPKWLIQTGKEGPRYEENPKYGTQKPAEWSEEDAHNLSQFIEKRAKAYDFNLPNRGYDIFGFAKDILKYLRINHEKVEWSEEDIDASVKSYSDSLPMCGEFQSYHDALVHAYRQGLVNALKSTRHQPHWKPNKEQINALKVVARGFPADDPGAIDSLLHDLEKLM